MDCTCFALPLRAGKTEAARAFLHALEGEQKAAYATSEQRLGITKEVWALQTLPGGEAFVVYIEAPDIGEAFRRFAASQDGFDRWFKDRVRETTGADLNVPPTGPMSDVLSVYEARPSATAPPTTGPAGAGSG